MAVGWPFLRIVCMPLCCGALLGSYVSIEDMEFRRALRGRAKTYSTHDAIQRCRRAMPYLFRSASQPRRMMCKLNRTTICFQCFQLEGAPLVSGLPSVLHAWGYLISVRALLV